MAKRRPEIEAYRDPRMPDLGWLTPFHVQRYILRDRGNKTWAVVDNRTREVLATDLTLLAAEGMMKLLKDG